MAAIEERIVPLLGGSGQGLQQQRMGGRNGRRGVGAPSCRPSPPPPLIERTDRQQGMVQPRRPGRGKRDQAET